jgi:hypothetical protein
MSPALRFAAVCVVAVAAMASAALLSGGRYHVTTIRSGAQYLMMVDRLTGAVWFCTASECLPVPHKPAESFGQNDPVVPRR